MFLFGFFIFVFFNFFFSKDQALFFVVIVIETIFVVVVVNVFCYLYSSSNIQFLLVVFIVFGTIVVFVDRKISFVN